MTLLRTNLVFCAKFEKDIFQRGFKGLEESQMEIVTGADFCQAESQNDVSFREKFRKVFQDKTKIVSF